MTETASATQPTLPEPWERDLAEGRAVAHLGYREPEHDHFDEEPDTGVVFTVANRWCVLWDSTGRWYGLDPDIAMDLHFICDADRGGTRDTRAAALERLLEDAAHSGAGTTTSKGD